MNPHAENPRTDDWKLVTDCLSGDAEAVELLRTKHLLPLQSILIHRGASPTEADDLLGSLWSDCVTGVGEKIPLLERYNGKCSLHNWLACVATNRLYDLLRRKKIWSDLPTPHTDGTGEKPGAGDQAAPTAAGLEPGLASLLCAALKAGFDACPPEELLMIRLVFKYGLAQRDLRQMWDVSEATISRRVNVTMALIKNAAEEHISKNDAGMKLVWEDIEELCRTHLLEFI